MQIYNSKTKLKKWSIILITARKCVFFTKFFSKAKPIQYLISAASHPQKGLPFHYKLFYAATMSSIVPGVRWLDFGSDGIDPEFHQKIVFSNEAHVFFLNKQNCHYRREFYPQIINEAFLHPQKITKSRASRPGGIIELYFFNEVTRSIT